ATAAVASRAGGFHWRQGFFFSIFLSPAEKTLPFDPGHCSFPTISMPANQRSAPDSLLVEVSPLRLKRRGSGGGP
ncbi:MAG: hypothetical protein AAGK05_19345, partial [Pseudomonadota bacterium]